MRCDRCGKETSVFRMSFFNTDNCCPACLKKEMLHPQYEEAKEKEREEVLKHNYNFPGIGLPSDYSA